MNDALLSALINWLTKEDNLSLVLNKLFKESEILKRLSALESHTNRLRSQTERLCQTSNEREARQRKREARQIDNIEEKLRRAQDNVVKDFRNEIVTLVEEGYFDSSKDGGMV